MAAQSPAVVTALQVKSTELCHAYFTALGHLQNSAPAPSALDEDAPTRAARMASYQGLVDELASTVVQKHREIEGLIEELERMPCSEEDELRRLREAQDEHVEATERLRDRATKTGASPPHARGRGSHAQPRHRVRREAREQRAGVARLAARIAARDMSSYPKARSSSLGARPGGGAGALLATVAMVLRPISAVASARLRANLQRKRRRASASSCAPKCAPERTHQRHTNMPRPRWGR